MLLCYTHHVPAPYGPSALLDLLNNVKWRCGHRVEHPNAVYSDDSRAQMFIQTQRDGKDKLEGVN